ncbi:MAG TPA: hypothetical protein VFQ45_07240 [Longimicrobium sp.]|nr:hypothetical protein [Longimicrobium sp.]
MAIPLPDLDDLAYADLLEEARTLIPALAPEWTNHNPSDPGITLVELFAWLAEMLVWRANQLPDAGVHAFLRLLNGPGWTGGGDLDAEVRATVLRLRDDDRAVTPADYERLATTAFNRWLADARAREGTAPDSVLAKVSPIARARCVPRRHLGAGTEAERARDEPGRVSVLVLPAPADAAPGERAAAPRVDEPTRAAVWGFLEERRLIATRVHVLPPVYVPVRVEAVVVRRPDVPDPAPPAALRDGWDRVPPTDVRRAALEALAAWLDPLRGGPGGQGWPFGGDVHLSDLYAVLERVPGVDHVADLRVTSACPDGDPACVAAPEARHPETGEQVGLALAAHHLPRAELRPEDVRVASAVVPVRVRVSLRPAAETPRDALERAVRAGIHHAFGPFGGGPDGDAAADVRAASVRAVLRALPEVDDRRFVHVRLEADAQRLQAPADPENQAVRFHAGQVAAPELALLLTDGTPLWA